MTEPVNLTDLLAKKAREREAPPNSAPTESAPASVEAPPVRTSAPRQSAPAPKPAPAKSARAASEQWTAHVNEFWDDIAPTLEPVDVVIVGHLLRLTVGFDRPRCTIGLPRLAERANVSPNTVRASLRRLERRGLVRLVEVESKTANAARGSVFELGLAPPKIERAKPARAAAAPAQPAPMISDQKEDQKASVYEIRTIAARLFEAHRYEPGFDHDRLRDLVRDALIGQGRQPDAEAIEEAIRGMAV